jgi:hypothetical protein
MISIDMKKARDIWRDNLRLERSPVLESLDLEFIRALESGNTEQQEKIKKQKQDLRDVPADPRIEKAQTAEDLKQLKLVDEIITIIK